MIILLIIFRTLLSHFSVAKSLAEKYRSITAEEKERLEGLAKGEKERYCPSYLSLVVFEMLDIYFLLLDLLPHFTLFPLTT